MKCQKTSPSFIFDFGSSENQNRWLYRYSISIIRSETISYDATVWIVYPCTWINVIQTLSKLYSYATLAMRPIFLKARSKRVQFTTSLSSKLGKMTKLSRFPRTALSSTVDVNLCTCAGRSITCSLLGLARAGAPIGNPPANPNNALTTTGGLNRSCSLSCRLSFYRGGGKVDKVPFRGVFIFGHRPNIMYNKSLISRNFDKTWAFLGNF